MSERLMTAGASLAHDFLLAIMRSLANLTKTLIITPY